MSHASPSREVAKAAKVLAYQRFCCPELSEVALIVLVMVAGQGVLPGALDLAAVTAVEERLAARQLARGAAHVADLRDALALHRLHADAGLGLCTVATLAAVLRCSELRAGQLLADARLLADLPGACARYTDAGTGQRSGEPDAMAATRSNERSRSALLCTVVVTISSSAPVAASSASSPRRTVSGPPMTCASSRSSTNARSCAVYG